MAHLEPTVIASLLRSNTPDRFWQCERPSCDNYWAEALVQAESKLGLPRAPRDGLELLSLTLGEQQFGESVWRLSPSRRLYYVVKPLLRRTLRSMLRKAFLGASWRAFKLGWPIEPRYVAYLYEILRQYLFLCGQATVAFSPLWPHSKRFAVVLTHDIESEVGQSNACQVADIDDAHGFKSSFNFVPERYPLNWQVIEWLRERGCEIGVHGLYHDGKLFSSRAEFMRRATRINQHLKAFDAVGFRSPCTLRQPEWMQALEIEYDLSFFDTDPFEPMPGGVMTLWPFRLGKFIELPYTLPQDSTIATVGHARSPDLWIQKATFIARYGGMVLLNMHPDYLLQDGLGHTYVAFLDWLCQQDDYWAALPRQVAQWWRDRDTATPEALAPWSAGTSYATLVNGVVQICTTLDKESQ